MMVAIQAGETDRRAEREGWRDKGTAAEGCRLDCLERRARSNVQASGFETIAARLDALELKLNLPVQAHVFSDEALAETKR